MTVLQRLRERFWFIPAVLCLTAVVVAEALIALDERLGEWRVPPGVDLVLYRVGESGSRDILGAIAASTLAVAGTVFSITMAVLALTSSSYGPRLVRNFMADRGNQTVLGVLTAVFLYSLVVLRSIRVQGDPGNQQGEVFVPHLAVNLAVLLAVANVGFLVYFIHHISDSIQIATLSSGVRTELQHGIDRLYPSRVGRDAAEVGVAPDRVELPERLEHDGARVCAGRAGYVQFVRDDELMTAACNHDVFLAMRVRPGVFVLDDTAVALVHPAERATGAVEDAVRSAVEIADARSPHQDIEFSVQQLTEMAVRALSPGTNDPYTAVNALDDLSSGLARLAAQELPSAARFDGSGVLRVHAPTASVMDVVTTVLDHMRWYATSAPSVMHATLTLVERVGRHARDVDVREQLLPQIRLLQEAFATAGHSQHDVRSYFQHAESVRSSLTRAGSSRSELDAQHALLRHGRDKRAVAGEDAADS